MLTVYAPLISVAHWGFQKVPGGFIPMQDQNYLIAIIQLPAGASLARTDKVVRATEKFFSKRPYPGYGELFGVDGATFTNATNAGAKPSR